MKPEIAVPAEFVPLYRDGDRLMQDLDAHLAAWPAQNDLPVPDEQLPADQKVGPNIDRLVERAQRWFNNPAVLVLPHTTYDRIHLQ